MVNSNKSQKSKKSVKSEKPKWTCLCCKITILRTSKKRHFSSKRHIKNSEIPVLPPLPPLPHPDKMRQKIKQIQKMNASPNVQYLPPLPPLPPFYTQNMSEIKYTIGEMKHILTSVYQMNMDALSMIK